MQKRKEADGREERPQQQLLQPAQGEAVVEDAHSALAAGCSEDEGNSAAARHWSMTVDGAAEAVAADAGAAAAAEPTHRPSLFHLRAPRPTPAQPAECFGAYGTGAAGVVDKHAWGSWPVESASQEAAAARHTCL